LGINGRVLHSWAGFCTDSGIFVSPLAENHLKEFCMVWIIVLVVVIVIVVLYVIGSKAQKMEKMEEKKNKNMMKRNGKNATIFPPGLRRAMKRRSKSLKNWERMFQDILAMVILISTQRP
jgi:hypothetical protein